MEIRGKCALVLGGAGLVGQAICRELIKEGVGEIVVSSLFEDEAKSFVETLKKEYGNKAPKLHAEWGNVFVRRELKDMGREDLLGKAINRDMLITDLLSPLSRDILSKATIYQLCDKYKPNIVIDSINTATAISYQNLFGAARETLDVVRRSTKEPNITEQAVTSVEKLLITQYLPQLIRHVQVFLASMAEAKTELYLKIGTCGTGGMGLNIPYTHSEDKPSQMLLAKSSVAGAQSLLLFLMGRTPNGPVIKELKPAAAIAWKRIRCDKIMRKGQPILLEDMAPAEAISLGDKLCKSVDKPVRYLEENGKPKALVAPFIDTGENGVFSLGEFETITDEGQMEYITPEEIAQSAVWEISGRNSGFDIVSALDHSVMGPTYRAGYMREQALDELRALVKDSGIESVAFEILGPPRLSKLLYEANLLKRLYGTFERATKVSADDASAAMEKAIFDDAELRSRIISIGIPILTRDGKRLIRGNKIAVPSDVPGQPSATFDITSHAVDTWSHDGWLDLRSSNVKRWQERLTKISSEISRFDSADTSSRSAKSTRYWKKADGGTEIDEAKLASWIFINEDQGERMKA